MTTTNDTTSVALLLGDPDDAGGAARVEELKLPTPVTPEGVVAQLAQSGISPSDVRARVELVMPPSVQAADAAILYATLAGFIGRFVPARLADGNVLPASAGNPGPRPEEIADQLTVTAGTDLTDLQVHYARRVTLDLEGAGPKDALELLVQVAAIRRRPRHDRLPDVSVAEGDPVRLEDARKAGVAHRGDRRKQAAGTLVELRVPSPRLERLQMAADAPIADVLRRLGATTDPTGEKWHCTRPDRHSNGDQNPSLKIVDAKTRCFRCDPEWVDSLRLVIDTLNMTPDEAAAWIESGEALQPLR